MIKLIARRELTQLLSGFGAYAVLASCVFLCAWFFLVALELFMLNQAALATRGFSIVVLGALASTAAWFFICLVPLLSMSLINAELRTKSLALLLSSPVSTYQIVLGKWLGLFVFLSALSVVLLLMPLSLAWMAQAFDWGLFVSVAMALLLLLMLLSSIGLYFSSLNQQAFSAAIASFSVTLILWVLGSSSNLYNNEDNFLALFSVSIHYQALLQGRFNSGDVLYFILLSFLCLILTVRQINSRHDAM